MDDLLVDVGLIVLFVCNVVSGIGCIWAGSKVEHLEAELKGAKEQLAAAHNLILTRNAQP